MDPAVIDDLASGIPALDLFVFRCKELNKKRGVEDNQRNVIEAAMALFTAVSKKDYADFQYAKLPTRLETIETQTAEQIRRINLMSIELRKVLEEQSTMLKRVKDAKNAVLDEYKDALAQFRVLMDNTDIENAGNMGQFHAILEGVIREVINEDNEDEDVPEELAIDVEEENQTSQFEALFEDQHVMDLFDRTFNTEDILQQGPMQGFLDTSEVPPPPLDDLQIQLSEDNSRDVTPPPFVSLVINVDQEEEEEEKDGEVPPTPPPTPRPSATRRRARQRRQNTLNLE